MKLEEFYKNAIELLWLWNNVWRLEILPVSLIKHKLFEKVTENWENFRVVINEEKIKLSELDLNLFQNKILIISQTETIKYTYNKLKKY